MAKRRYPHHLKKYWFKKGRKRRRKSRRRRKHTKRRHTRKATHHMAKRRHRRRYHRRGGHRRRRRGGGGRMGLLPSREDFTLMAGAAAIGFLENKAKADAGFILNKIPRPIKQLGYTGGTALALQVAAHFTHNRYLKLAAKSAWMIAAYQVGSLGKLPDGADKALSLSGFDDEQLLGDPDLGALAAEGDEMGAITYDARIEEPMV